MKTNAGAAGVDPQTIEQIEQDGVEGFLAELASELRRDVTPRAVRRVGSRRQMASNDRWASRRYVIAWHRLPRRRCWSRSSKPTFGSSYGFRPKRSAHQACEQLRQAVNAGANWIVELDIEAFYDRIDHELLMRLVERRIYDRRVLKLLRKWLKAGVLDEGKVLPSDQGVPQGGVITPPAMLQNTLLSSR